MDVYTVLDTDIQGVRTDMEEEVKMTIYLPDDLAAEVKDKLGDANISGICQDALRAELERVEAKARARALAGEGDFERITTCDPHRDRDVAFQGRSIGTDPDSGKEAYLTPKGNIAVVDGDADRLVGVYASFGNFASAGHAYDLVADAADSLGEKPPVQEWDI
jgi:post-segregation antitoxin (ccd killing protein)